MASAYGGLPIHGAGCGGGKLTVSEQMPLRRHTKKKKKKKKKSPSVRARHQNKAIANCLIAMLIPPNPAPITTTR